MEWPESICLENARTVLEPQVFSVMRRYLETLRSWWRSHSLQKSSKSIVIYETRCHEQLEFLILNCCYFASEWALTIFCSEENYDFLCSILGSNREKARIIVRRKHEGEYSAEREEYNQFLISKEFWTMMSDFGYTHVLMAEVDSYLCDHVETIDSLYEYDYIASRWNWMDAPGGGGLSIRRVSKMLELCDIPIDAKMQDCWASEGIQRVGGIVNNTIFAESCFLEKAWGTHQWWAFVTSETLQSKRDIYEEYMRLNL